MMKGLPKGRVLTGECILEEVEERYDRLVEGFDNQIVMDGDHHNGVLDNENPEENRQAVKVRNFASLFMKPSLGRKLIMDSIEENQMR